MAIVEVLGVGDTARKSASENKMKDVKRKCPVPARGAGKPDLMDVRVVQRRLVYAVGLSADICSDQALKSMDFFGKYGKIKKISVTWSNHASPARQATAAAYVLFHNEEDAWNCIQGIDGVKWSGKQVRACFGTTKYCHAYLRNVACTNAECSYLHEPAPEEDTVTKEEMNPMTGRKEVLQLVYPGGVPRGVSKISYKGARGATILQPSAESSPSTMTESVGQTPTKLLPTWAIPVPSVKGEVMSEITEGSLDVSLESSPQFVIPTAAPCAWPSLTEIASARTESLLSRASSNGGGVRPSAKDIVTGSAAAGKPREAPKKMMMPLAVASSKARGARVGAAKDADLPASPTPTQTLSESEHALSTMPSSELSSSRARLDTNTEDTVDAAGSPGAMLHVALSSSLTLADMHDAGAVGMAGSGLPRPGVADSDSVGEESAEADKENAADAEAEVVTPRSTTPSSTPETMSVGEESPGGLTPVCRPPTTPLPPDPGIEVSGALSARDLLPASLEDILEDPVAEVKPRAASDIGSSSEKASTAYARPSLDSHLVMPARRKQSRFAFATTPASKANSLSLPHDLDSLNAPAVAPEALLGQVAAPEFRGGDVSPARESPVRAAFDKSMLPENIMQALYSQQEQQTSAACAAAVSAAASARMLAPAAPGTLEQPPMTHESVVQAVSAELQAIMSQGSGGWTSSAKVPEQPAPEPLPAAELQMLQALLFQELGNTAARAQEQRGVRVPLRGAGNAGMPHLQVSQAPSTGRQHGLPIKRTSPHASLKLGGRSSSFTMQPTQRAPPISQLYRAQSSHVYGQPQHSAAMSGAYEAQFLAASHAVQHSRSAAHMPMDAHTQARLRAAQQQMTAPYVGADAAYIPDAGYYGGWEGAAGGDMYNMAGVRAAQMQHQALAGARQASWPRRAPSGLYWE